MSRAKILAPFCWIWSVAKRSRRSLQLSKYLKNKDIFDALLWGEVDILSHPILSV